MYKVINNSTFCHLRLGLTRPLDNHKTMSLLHSINSSWYPLLIICYILCHLCSLLSFAFKMDPEGLPLPREFQRVTSPTGMRSGSGKQIDISSLYWNSSTIEWDEIGFLAFLFPFDIWKQTARESQRKKTDTLKFENLAFAELQDVSCPLFRSCKPFGCPQRSWNSSQETGLSFLGNCNRATPIPEKIRFALQFPFKLFQITLWHTGNMTNRFVGCPKKHRHHYAAPIWANSITVIKYLHTYMLHVQLQRRRIDECRSKEAAAVWKERLAFFQ